VLIWAFSQVAGWLQVTRMIAIGYRRYAHVI